MILTEILFLHVICMYVCLVVILFFIKLPNIKSKNRILLNNNLQSENLQLQSYFKIGNLWAAPAKDVSSTLPIATVDANLFQQIRNNTINLF